MSAARCQQASHIRGLDHRAALTGVNRGAAEAIARNPALVAGRSTKQMNYDVGISRESLVIERLFLTAPPFIACLPRARTRKIFRS
jgi:hypothetical protein